MPSISAGWWGLALSFLRGYYGGKFDVVGVALGRCKFGVSSVRCRWGFVGGSPSARRRHTRGTAAARLRLAAAALSGRWGRAA